MQYVYKTQPITLESHPLFEEISKVVKENLYRPIPSCLSREDYLRFKIDGDRTKSENVYFKRRKLLTCYSLYLQYKKSSDVFNYFVLLIESTIKEISWVLPAHLNLNHFDKYKNRTVDLFAAETGETLIEIVKMFEEELPNYLCKQIQDEVFKRVIEPFDLNEWNWESEISNWTSVCASCIGIITLLSPQMGKSEIRLQRINHDLQIYLNSLNGDGICTEGLEYWSYGFGYFIYYYDFLTRIDSTTIPFSKEQLKNIGEMPYKIQLSVDQFANFSDVSTNQQIPSGLINYCNQKFSSRMPYFDHISSLDFDHCYRYAHVSRNLWWTDSLNKKRLQTYQKFFSNSQWLIDRRKNWTLMFKGGHNCESHNHHDVGSFVLAANNKMVLVDLGSPIYFDGYFDKKRYSVPHTQTQWHSVPQINNGEQLESNNSTRIKKIVMQEETRVEIALDNVYPENIERTLIFTDGELTVKDKFYGNQNYIEHFIFKIEPSMNKMGCLVNVGENHFVKFNWNIEGAKLDKITTKNHMGEEEVYYRITIDVFDNAFNMEVMNISQEDGYEET